jgi:hypothetical protein
MMMKKNLSVHFIKLFLGLVLLFLVGSVVVNFMVDPIQLYRRSEKMRLWGDPRWQNAGFIKNFDYNLVVIGTSMVQNFSPAFIKKSMHYDPMILSLSGSTIIEQRIVLETALKTKKVKAVIWGIDLCYLNYKPHSIPPSFPIHLYGNSLRGAIQYLVNFDVFLEAALSSFNKIMGRNNINPDDYSLEKYDHWHEQARFSKEIILKQYHAHLKPNPLKQDTQKTDSINYQETNLLNDVVSIIKQYPDVQFYIFLPPYSLACYKLEANCNTSFESHLKIRKIMVGKLTSLPNVSIYDFETDLSITGNLDNYKDLTHYSQHINNDIILKMKNNVNRVTPDNIQEKNNAFRKQVLLPLE